ncbi:MAG: HpcH/HpaI aldolase/citrate lyase family protein [Burkholderiales bacterium]
MPLYRTLLFAPGNHPRRIEKAFTLGADAVILDLEDSVPPAEKVASRAQVAQALANPRSCRGYVRVNAMGTPYCYGDLVATVGKGVDGVVLPKVESAADLHSIDWLLANLERDQGLRVGALDLIPIIETAAGLSRIERILQARTLKPYSGVWRVQRVAFGAADLSNDLQLSPAHDEPELAYARARLVLASRAAGLDGPLDSPWFHFKDIEGFRRAIEGSRRSGYQGRLCIHPDQVELANEGYAPTAEEIAAAERVVAAFQAAEAAGAAAIQVDGQMIDYPIAQRAQRLLKAVKGEG